MAADGRISLTVTGDMMFYGPMAAQMRAHDDPLWAFGPLGDALRQTDLLFGNFETPITVAQQAHKGAPDCYFSPPGIGAALKAYGYSVVNLAHNHIYDFGAEGVEATINELRSADLPFFGMGCTPEEAAQPAIVTTPNGQRVGFLGYTTAQNALDHSHTYVACPPDVDRIRADVAALRGSVDAIVVSCHTGTQFCPYPSPETRAIARAAIEAGAAVFLGHHPHVPQGTERIGDGLALYSLGDFVAPVQNEQTRRAYFGRIELAHAAVRHLELVPCYLTDDCRTTLAEGELRDEIHAHLMELTRQIAAGESDDLHFAYARKRFFSQYVTSWLEELRQGGPLVLLKKFTRLRPYHYQLMAKTLLAPFRRRRR